MMGLIKKLFTNCACPQGRMGRAMLKFMTLCHAPLTNWGLKLVNIQDGWTSPSQNSLTTRPLSCLFPKATITAKLFPLRQTSRKVRNAYCQCGVI